MQTAMEESMFATVRSQTLNLRSAASLGDNVIATLVRNQVVTLEEPRSVERWAAVAHEGRRGFAARRLLAQSPDQSIRALPPEMGELVSRVVSAASKKYDGITYRLGCKAKRRNDGGLTFSGSDVAGRSCSGSTVDCSGWISGLFQMIAAEVNRASGRVVFDVKDTGRLSNHSDGQIASVGAAVGQVYSGRDIDGLHLRTGLLFGLNAGDYDWEGQGRALDIDHIVMGVESPDGYAITQSSSGGGGVNTVPWRDWRKTWAKAIEENRVHCVDLLDTGDWERTRSGSERRSTEETAPEVEPMDAPAG